MFQSGLSRIDFTARCAAGSHHDLYLQKITGLETELMEVLSERWEGCTYSVLCLGSDQSGSIRLTDCQRAVERGEAVVAIGDDEVSLVSLLGSGGLSQLEPEAQEMATTLQFCRAMAVGLTGEFRSTGMCRRFCAELDSELDRQLGGTFADGFCWSTRLQEGGLATAAAAAGEDLAQTEAAAVADGRNRACALLGALGRLYERSHLLLLAGPEPQSMRGVLACLLSPFAWLRPTLLRLAESHGLRDVDAPEIVAAFEVLAAIPESVPPLRGAQFEPEPELEPEPEPEL